MIPQCIMFSIYSLWLEREKLFNTKLDVKTWCAAHFPVNCWRCSNKGGILQNSLEGCDHVG
jgi:hypothetical protein